MITNSLSTEMIQSGIATASSVHDDGEEDVFDSSNEAQFEAEVDGRTMRRRRNRDAVIVALIDLINEGDLDPTVATIADRAEVSHRSIFRYFDDLNDLAKTAVETELRNVWPESVISDLGKGNLEHRINQFVSAQIRMFQRTHALGRVARGKMLAIPELEEGLMGLKQLRRSQVIEQFEPELKRMNAAESAAVAIGVTAMLSFESFDMQRRALGMSIAEVTDTSRSILTRLFRDLG